MKKARWTARIILAAIVIGGLVAIGVYTWWWVPLADIAGAAAIVTLVRLAIGPEEAA